MAASNARHAFGTTLGMDPAGGSSYTTIGELTDLTGPGLARESVDVTHTTSPDACQEFIRGLKNGGELQATFNFLPADTSHQLLTDDWMKATNEANATFKVTFSDAAPTAWSFAGFVTNIQPAAPIRNGALALTATIKVAASFTPPT